MKNKVMEKLEKLEQEMRFASYQVSVTNNETTRRKFDDAVNAVIAFRAKNGLPFTGNNKE